MTELVYPVPFYSTLLILFTVVVPARKGLHFALLFCYYHFFFVLGLGLNKRTGLNLDIIQINHSRFLSADGKNSCSPACNARCYSNTVLVSGLVCGVWFVLFGGCSSREMYLSSFWPHPDQGNLYRN